MEELRERSDEELRAVRGFCVVREADPEHPERSLPLSLPPSLPLSPQAPGDASEVIRELHARGLSASVTANGKWVESVQNGDGFTPLHLVEHPGSARALVELGADPDAFGVSQFGSDYGTPVFMAAANGKAEVLKIMLPACSYVSGSWCWWAAKLGKGRCVKVLLGECP